MPARVRSMTGFATTSGDGFVLGIKSVNHRFLDLRLHLPSGSDALEGELRTQIKARVARGHVELTLTLEQRPGGGLRLNGDTLAAYLAAFAEAARVHDLPNKPDLNALLRLPEVMTTEAPAPTDRALRDSAVLGKMPELLQRFDAAREAEGAALESVLRTSVLRIGALAAEITLLREGVRPLLVERLRLRIAEALTGAGTAIAPERLLSEAAMLADRSDIEEEIVRLRAHVVRFTALLDEGSEVGKRLDFLLQEFGRESNTMLSKTGGAAGPDSLRLTELGLEVKAEVERMREQVQNIE